MKKQWIIYILALIPTAVLTFLHYKKIYLTGLPLGIDKILMLLVLTYSLIGLFKRLEEDASRPLLVLFIIAMACRLLGCGISIIYPFKGAYLLQWRFFGDPGILAFYLLIGGGLTLYCRVNIKEMPKKKWYMFMPYIILGLPLYFLLNKSLHLVEIIYQYIYYGIIRCFIYKLIRLPFKYNRITTRFLQAISLILIHDILLGIINHLTMDQFLFILLPLVLAGFILFPASITKGKD